MYAFLGCGSLSAECPAISLNVFFFLLGVTLDSAKTPFGRTPLFQTTQEGCGCPKFLAGKVQKNPRVRKIRVRNSGAGNGCANFMDTRKKCVLSAGKTMSVKFLVLGGGYFGFWGGGGSADFIFMGARIFLKSFPANFDTAGKVFTDFPPARNVYLTMFAHFPARKMAAGKSAPPSLRNAPGFSPLGPPQPS